MSASDKKAYSIICHQPNTYVTLVSDPKPNGIAICVTHFMAKRGRNVTSYPNDMCNALTKNWAYQIHVKNERIFSDLLNNGIQNDTTEAAEAT